MPSTAADAAGAPWGRRRGRDALLLLLLALVIRLAYLALVYHGPDSLRLTDSGTYEEAAAALLGNGAPMDWTERMPAYPLFLAGVRFFAGPDPLWPVLLQLGIDSVSCLLIAMLAAALDRRLFLLAGILAAINLDMISAASSILTESLFLPPYIAGLIAASRFIQAPSAGRAGAAGLCLGLALLVRSVLLFFLPLLLLALALAAWRHRVPPKRAAAQIALALVAALVPIAPTALDHYARWDHLQLVSQGGRHALFWVAPAAREFVLGIPFEQGQAEMKTRLERALAARGAASLPPNPFEAAAFQEEVASGALRELGLVGLAEAWFVGTAINLGAPALIAVPPVADMARPHFYETSGGGAFGKVAAFVAKAAGSPFFWLMLPALVWTAAARVVALAGLARIGRPGGLPLGPALYLIAVAGYFIAVTGPVTGVKYRLPLEPILILLLASGLMWLADLCKARRPKSGRLNPPRRSA
jgi:hypothetical protein